jgi:hypothetical protein
MCHKTFVLHACGCIGRRLFLQKCMIIREHIARFRIGTPLEHDGMQRLEARCRESTMRAYVDNVRKCQSCRREEREAPKTERRR